MIARLRTIAAVVAIALALGAARRAAADEAGAAEEASSPPSAALLVFGVTIAVGGGALQYYAAHRFVSNASASPGWLALSSVGALTAELGGVVTAYWGWRLGENHFLFDRAGAGPIKERRSMALTAVAIGAIAFAVTYVAEGFVFARTFNCETQAIVHSVAGGAAERCAKDQILTATFIELGADAVLLAVAPFAGYGFGYDAAAKRANETHGLRYSLAPAVLADGAGARTPGLLLIARF